MSPQRIVIVGAGIVGLSTAYALLSRGVQQVTILEQEAVDHHRATSHGISRLLRFGYGPDLFYSHMVGLSLQRWKHLECCSRRTLYTRTGVLTLGASGDTSPKASFHIMQELGIAAERLSRQSCKQRFPQFAVDSADFITYNPEAGILHASTCLQTLKACILDLGGTIYESCCVTHFTHENHNRPVRLHTSTGDEIAADRVVLAIGPWVHHLLADLHLPVRLTRQYILYFAGLPLSSYGVNSFPAFMMDDLYGFPLHKMAQGSGPYWLKAASHAFGRPTRPDDILPPDELVVTNIARRLRELLPALQQATLARIDSCMYDVTPDEDFIIDRLPDDPRIVFATGLSGHGFKFGPLLGEILCSLLCETDPPVSLERFQLARFSHWKASVA